MTPNREKAVPRILASQVVEFVERSFPKLKETGDLESLDPGSYQTLAILAAMVDSLDEQTFGNLNAADYTDLVVATSYIKATVTRWQFPPTPGHGNHSVSKFAPLNNRNPVVVIRSILQALHDFQEIELGDSAVGKHLFLLQAQLVAPLIRGWHVRF